MTATSQQYTPALGYAWLTPWYDFAIRCLTREQLWRARLVEEIRPVAGDRILDVGCGTGQLAFALLSREPRTSFVGIDPDERVLATAEARVGALKADARLVCGVIDDSFLDTHEHFTKAVSSLVLHQVSLTEKRRILSLMRRALQPSGELFIADYAEQPTWMMRILFRNTVQRLDGFSNTEPNARGVLAELMQDVGFIDVTLRQRIHTATGAISIYRAKVDSRSERVPRQ